MLYYLGHNCNTLLVGTGSSIFLCTGLILKRECNLLHYAHGYLIVLRLIEIIVFISEIYGGYGVWY